MAEFLLTSLAIVSAVSLYTLTWVNIVHDNFPGSKYGRK